MRLLYDGMGCIALPKSYTRPIIDAGGEVAVFFPPFLPHINIRVNYRNHRKITVIDGKTAFIGGLNLGDEYLVNLLNMVSGVTHILWWKEIQ